MTAVQGTGQSDVPVEQRTPVRRRDVSISMARVNLLALPLAVIPLPLFGLPYVALWGWQSLAAGMREFIHPWVLIPGLIAGILLHELLHGLAWMVLGGKGWRAISFGFKVSTLTPYAHCREPIAARAYRWGALVPAIVLGLLPVAVAYSAGEGVLLVFGILFLIAAGGDFLVVWIIRSVPGDLLVEDHPERAGCIVLEPVERIGD